MASSKSTIDIVIETVCKFTGIDAAKRALKSLRTHVGDFAKTVATNLTNIKSGFEMIGGVVRTFSGIAIKALKAAFSFEGAKTAFTGLLNSVDKSAKHIDDLRKFASQTPLTFEDLQRASKLLLSFGADVEDVMPSLKMLGDISMGNAQKFQGLALVFAQVKAAGKLMGHDLLQMINQGFNPLTVMAQKTGKSVSELKDIMSKGGITFEMVAEAMRLATTEGGLFNNAMEGASKTANGLMSTLQDNWTDALRTFGAELMDVAKGGLQWCINKLHELKESGAIKEWAEKSKTAIYSVIGAFDALTDSSSRSEVWGAIKDVTVGGFELAANKAVEVLTKAAPIIGGLIASGFTNLKDIFADMLSDTAAETVAASEVMDEFRARGKTTTQLKGVGLMGTALVESPDDQEEFDRAVAERTARVKAEMRKQKVAEAKSQATDLASDFLDKPTGGESIEEIKAKLAELKERREKIVAEVEESRKPADDVDHAPETVAVAETRNPSEVRDHTPESVSVKEERAASESVKHIAESVAVIEERASPEPSEHKNETVAVIEERQSASSVDHAPETVAVAETRDASRPVAHPSESVAVAETRNPSEVRDHSPESVAVKEERGQTKSLDHLAESVDVIENRIETSPAEHPSESVAVEERRTVDKPIAHAAETVEVSEIRPDAAGSIQREEVVRIDADISAYEKKLKDAERGMSRFERGINTLKKFGERALKKVEVDAAKIAEEEKRAGGSINTEMKANTQVFDNIGKNVVEDEKKAREKLEAERLRAVEEEKKAREKMETELHALRVKDTQDELQAYESAASSAQRRISRAQTEFDKAFGMYRSADHGAAQIAEERDYAADYKQLQRDASFYGGKDRIDELAGLMAAGDTKGQQAKLEEWRKSSFFTPEVESMVRAAAADQTKTTAEDELRQINANTKELADKLDQLLQVK